MIVDDTSLFDNIANNILRQHCNSIEISLLQWQKHFVIVYNFT